MPVTGAGYGNYGNDPPTVVGQPVSGYDTSAVHVAMGVPYRVHPSEATAASMPWLSKFPDKRQDNKLEAIKSGGVAAEQYEKLPEERPWYDTFWIFAFVLVGLGGVGLCFRYMGSDILRGNDPTVAVPTVGDIVLSGFAGGIASLLTASAFLQLAKSQPACVVWTSLIFGPCLSIAVGVACIAVATAASVGAMLYIVGFVFILMGFLSLFCVFFCWRHLIPFMIKLVEVVATIVQENPMMIAVSLLGSALGIAWSVIMGISFFGLYHEFYAPNASDDPDKAETGVGYFLYFCVCLVLVWGGLTANNLCHVTYVGVFGRWYFNKDENVRLRKSFMVAIGPSFGSICLGSFIIAVIRALEYTVRLMRRDAQEDGNVVCCVILLIIECLIGCIGDFMEYFSEWAYVQVAIRGCSFCQAVKITYAMCSCANISYIIQDLLLDSVVSLGSLICAAVGTCVGALVGWGLGGAEKLLAGCVIGLFAGFICGGTAIGVLSSGVKTILSLWAESPEELQRTRPELHAEFDRRIRDKFG